MSYMTVSDVEREVLSLRCWLRRSVLPASLLLLAALAWVGLDGSSQARDHKAVIFGFAALYFVLLRGGHILMIRSLHAELKRGYPDAYAERLARLPTLRRRNAGFVLARIKRDMIDAGVIPNPNRVD